MLNRDPRPRLKFCARVKEAPFFAGVHWDTIRTQKPEIVPQTRDSLDTSYFAARDVHFPVASVMEAFGLQSEELDGEINDKLFGPFSFDRSLLSDASSKEDRL